ncbi:hypothetical protein Acr_00g0012030 [Actinidia rufa]|uniref:Uncharacterized protein n=1 Tax=Actinidia rufa TaxID=165716 RepID=A0A7J0DBF9_9ERIC|nr:hypothetical protein Acr_00g0012030 [Actinidia rufa]
MWRMLTVMRRNLQNMRKSPRVADENMFGDRNGAELAELPMFGRGIERRDDQDGTGFQSFTALCVLQFPSFHAFHSLISAVLMEYGCPVNWEEYQR